MTILNTRSRPSPPPRTHARVARWLLALGMLPAALLPPAPAAGAEGDEPFVVVRARKAITVSGEEINDAVIVIAGGKIENVGKGLEYPLNSRVIDVRDRVVMPGLIAPRTRVGLPPMQRKGVHGDFSVAAEYFPLPEVNIELLRAGYTTVALVPGGEDIPGRAIVVRTGGPPEARTLRSPSYLRVAPDKKVLREALERAEKEIEKQKKAREDFDKKQEERRKKEAEASKAAPQTQPATQPGQPPTTQPEAAKEPVFEPPPIDPKLQVLVDLIQKKQGELALLEVGGAGDVVLFGDVLKKHDIAHAYALRHLLSTDFRYVAEQLGQQHARVVMLPIITYWSGSVEREHLPRMLSKAGCEVSLNPLTDQPREFQRMFTRLAELVREGWPREEALKSVTLHPARLLGLDTRLGSIEKGKDADLILLDGDPLDPGVRVRGVIIGGELVFELDRSPDGQYVIKESR